MEMKDSDKQIIETLRAENERFRKELAMKNEYLESSYYCKAIARYRLNITKGIVEDEIVLETDEGPVRLMESLGLKPPCRMDDLFPPLVAANVEPEYRYWCGSYFTRDSMFNYYNAGNGEATFEYRRSHSAPGPQYLRQTILMAKDPDTGDIIGIGNAKDVTNRYRMLGATTKAELDVTRTAVLQSLSEIYYLTYFIDIVDRSYIPLATHPDVASIILAYPYVQDAVNAACRGFVTEEHLAAGLEFLDLGTLPERMKGRNIISADLETKNLGWVRVSFIAADHMDNGDLASGIIAVQEIDREKRIELERQAELENALKMAESASKAKTDFLFNMSHDIRTPMNAIIGFTNIARKSLDDPEKLTDSLNKIDQSGSLLLSLINSILDMSRIESGKAVLDEKPGDVLYSFADIEPTLQQLARTKDIGLSFRFGDIRDRYVFCDFDRSTRIFINIITNAIKYTKPGGRVNVSCEQVGEAKDGVGTYRYIFEDNGIGMSEEFQKHVFEEFSREENSTTSGIEGTGLGLSVCKSFTELMHGTIEFRSQQGVGTTFIVTLPFRLQNPEDTLMYIDPETGLTVKAGTAHAGAGLDFTGKKVLLVEDNELNREIAVDILAEKGLVIETAENGSIAVEMMREKGPDYYDFILMDIQMPVMGGYDATAAIRAMYPDAKLPIIALSANAFAEDRAASVAAGMNDHIAKPINIQELFSCLAKFL